jgi:nitric oxide reductase NorQ protein
MKTVIVKPEFIANSKSWKFVNVDTNAYEAVAIRDSIAKIASDRGELLEFNTDTGRAKRIKSTGHKNKVTNAPVAPKQEMMENPVLNFVHNEAVGLKPKTLIMPDLKWKYLVRSAMRGKNIMMTGPAGTGKTQAAKTLVTALNRPDFYFNLGATQDPRGTLIGNTHFKKDTGTTFCESVFVKAIQTENAVILLDELSRAHPEAWNILMTVLDPGQRYLRLDEHQDAPTIAVAPGVTFIATANIGTEYTATRVMDRALVDRFIIIEMEALDAVNEASLLKMLHPNLDNQIAADIAEIAAITRKECRSESPKLTSAVSTRLCVEIAGLIEDGFSLGEAAEVCIYPFFDDAGGLDSERTYVKQVVQKYCGAKVEEDIFNTGAPVNSNMPF